VLPWLWRQFGQRTRPPSPPTAISGGEPSPADVYYEAAARFLDVQLATHEVLDNKAFNTFSVGSTVLPLTFGLLSLASGSLADTALALLALALLAYLSLLFCAWRASRIRALEYRPDIPTLRGHSERFGADSLRRWVANEYAESSEANRKALVVKARWTGPRSWPCTPRARSSRPRPSPRSYCERTSLGGGSGLGVRTMMLDGPGGGSWVDDGRSGAGLALKAIEELLSTVPL